MDRRATILLSSLLLERPAIRLDGTARASDCTTYRATYATCGPGW